LPPAFALLLLASAQDAPDLIQDMIARSRATLPTVGPRCAPQESEDEIVVCGRRREGPDPNRLPLPVAPEPGTRLRGELSTSTAALTPDTCLQRCPQPLSIDVIGAIGAVAKGVDILVNGQ